GSPAPARACAGPAAGTILATAAMVRMVASTMVVSTMLMTPMVVVPMVLVQSLGAPAQALIRGSILLSAGQSVLKKRTPRGAPNGTLRGAPDPATEATRARETAAVQLTRQALAHPAGR